MGSSLISNYGSEAQLQTNLLTNTPNRVKVLVEDELDVPIWNEILTNFTTGYTFEVSPYSYDSRQHGKGKRGIIALNADFGPNFIGCVDSDYDWILERWTSDGQIILSTPYILQTFAYSIENLAALPYGKSECMLQSTLHCSPTQITLDDIYEYFIEKLSENIYEVLLWHLTMQKEQVHLDKISAGWDYIFNNIHYASVLTDSSLTEASKRNEILNIIGDRANDLSQNYQVAYPELIGKRGILQQELNQTSILTPQNAFLFMRGHNLHDFLIHNFYRPIYLADIKAHTNDIRNHTVGADTNSAINHYKSLKVPFERIYIYRTDYLSHPDNFITQLLRSSISSIF